MKNPVPLLTDMRIPSISDMFVNCKGNKITCIYVLSYEDI